MSTHWPTALHIYLKTVHLKDGFVGRMDVILKMSVAMAISQCN